jgi:hypothetical protein
LYEGVDGRRAKAAKAKSIVEFIVPPIAIVQCRTMVNTYVSTRHWSSTASKFKDLKINAPDSRLSIFIANSKPKHATQCYSSSVIELESTAYTSFEYIDSHYTSE